ncbi:MAG: hypothetical protein QW231_01900 [Candidatus Bathyarchaeia archaeon]
MSDKGPRLIPKFWEDIEEDIEKIRGEPDRKIEELTRVNFDLIRFLVISNDALLRLVFQVMPPSKENFVKFLQYNKELIDHVERSDIREEIKSNMILGLKNNLKGLLEAILKTKFLSFEEMADVFLMDMGRELTRELVSPNLIAELWGSSALQKFNEIIKK